MTTRMRWRALVLVPAMAVLATTTVGCGGGGGDLPTPPSVRTEVSTQPAPDLTTEEQAAVDESREVFDLFMAAYIDVATSDEVPHFDTHFRYTQYAGSPIDVDAVNEIGDNFLEDRVAEGSITWEFVEVIDVDLDRAFRDAPAPELRLRYCIDETDWAIVNRNTGERVSGPGSRSLSVVTFTWQEDWGDASDRGWRVADREDEEAAAC